jgi:hypothetical protein
VVGNLGLLTSEVALQVLWLNSVNTEPEVLLLEASKFPIEGLIVSICICEDAYCTTAG